MLHFELLATFPILVFFMKMSVNEWNTMRVVSSPLVGISATMGYYMGDCGLIV